MALPYSCHFLLTNFAAGHEFKHKAGWRASSSHCLTTVVQCISQQLTSDKGLASKVLTDTDHGFVIVAAITLRVLSASCAYVYILYICIQVIVMTSVTFCLLLVSQFAY